MILSGKVLSFRSLPPSKLFKIRWFSAMKTTKMTHLRAKTASQGTNSVAIKSRVSTTEISLMPVLEVWFVSVDLN